MNTYFIFWIKEEFIDDLFYKGDLLYQFLDSYLNDLDNHNLHNQYAYITNEFSKSALIPYFKSEHLCRENIKIANNKIEIYNEFQYISLHIYKKHLLFQCETLLDAEELLLSSLRRYNSHLFILGKDIENFGWITPVINNEEYKSEQQLTLFSYF